MDILIIRIFEEFLKNFSPEEKYQRKIKQEQIFLKKKTSSHVYYPWVNLKTTQISKKKKMSRWQDISFLSHPAFASSETRSEMGSKPAWSGISIFISIYISISISISIYLYFLFVADIPLVDLYLIFEKSSCKNQFRRTAFLACKNQFRNWFFQATQQVVKIQFKID